ncbi:MAG: hypothetical protein K2P81_15400 [Bacteriovoracaceae bacterium]|nr:hypothetical protein [Bacteriovoracaceae bacterium]
MIKRLAILVATVGMFNAQAAQQELDKYLTIGSVRTEVETLTQDGSFTSVMEQELNSNLRIEDLPGIPVEGSVRGEKATIGEVIQIANDVIALGEKIYAIVKKGKPVLNMQYAPISVLPKTAAGQPVDVMDMEGWSIPVSRKIRMVYKNLYGAEVVVFSYTVVYSYGGSMDGKGAFITAAQVVPHDVSVSWGYELNAVMKLVGLQNHGTKANPIAGAIISINYKVETVLKTIETNDSYHITGKGQLIQL